MPPSTTEKQMWIILKAKDATQAAFKSMKKTGTQSLKALQQGFKALEVAVLGVSTAIMAGAVVATKKLITATNGLLKSSVNTAAQFESFRIQFNVLMGGVEAGTKIFDELWAVAKRLPFTIDEIVSSARRMKAWGVIGTDVAGGMTALADASAVAGVNMERMSNIIGRAWQMGTFLARGPGAMLRGLMRTKMGIEATHLSLDEFRKALADLLTNPKYGVAGMSNQLAQTFIGLRSMIADAVTNIKLTISEAGLFDEVKKLQSDILDWLRRPEIINKIRQIGSIAADSVAKLRSKLQSMVESGMIDDLIDQWIGVVRRWFNIINTVIGQLPNIAKGVLNMIESIMRAMEGGFKALDEMIKKMGLVAKIPVSMELGEVDDQLKQLGQSIARFSEKIAEDFGESIQTVFTPIMRKSLTRAEFTELVRLEEVMRSVGITQATWNKRAAERNEILKVAKTRMSDTAASLQKHREELADTVEFWDKGVAAGVDFDQIISNMQKLMAGVSVETLEWNTGLAKTPSLIDNITKSMMDFAKNTSVGQFFQQITASAKKTSGDVKGIISEMFQFDPPEATTLTERWEKFMDIKTMKDRFQGMADVAQGTAEAMAGSFETLFFDFFTDELKSLNDYLSSFFKDFMRMVSQMLARQVAMNLMAKRSAATVPVPAGGAGAGATGAQIAASVAPSLLGMLGVPAYQKGGIVGMRDHVPAMVGKGEMILTKKDQAALLGAIRGGSAGGGNEMNVNLNITAMDGADVFRTLDKNQGALSAVLQKMAISGKGGMG